MNAGATALFEAARSGSLPAVGELFDQCRNYLLLVANASIGKDLQSRVAASDVVQETFLEAGRIFDRFQGNSSAELLRWLTRILENRLGNVVKRHLCAGKRDASRDVPLEGFLDRLGESLADAGVSPSAIVSADEDLVRVQIAILQLPEDFRRVIELRIHQGLAFDEVGRTMDRTSEAVRKLFARAVEELRLRMTRDDRQPDSNG